MSEKAIKEYLQLLSVKMSSMFDIPEDVAANAIQKSVIQELIRDMPEYVDHVPLSSWAEEIHKEMFA